MLAAAIVPVYSGATSSGSGVVTASSRTLVGQNGYWVLGLMAVPALLGLVVWFGLHRRCTRPSSNVELLVRLPVGLLYAFSFLGGFSVGAYVAPAAVVLAFAGAITPRATA